MSNEADPHIFDRAASFVSEMWSHHGPGSEMHIGDLAWGTFHHWPSALEAIRLWPDHTGTPQVLTMFNGSNVCDLVVRPGQAGLGAAEVALEWAENERLSCAAGTDPVTLRVGRRLQSAEVVDLLHTRGYERLASGAPAMSRTITTADTIPPSPPEGYEIRELRADDLESRVAAFNAAFPGEALRMEAYRALQACSAYVPSLDIVATSPAGPPTNSVAAFATLWLDPLNRVAQIEPTGCHPHHRRRGLTRAVILHALNHTASLGATEALVRHVSTNDAANSLYRSCGFTTVSEHTGFAKTLRR
jgi:ribosomal protein S18 acetylase RimI-like enzyme